PADGKLLESNRLFVTEAMLTGESVPVVKKEEDEVFMGTVVTAGNALMQVEKTGKHTQMGKIALQIQEPSEDTPLKKQLVRFSKQLTVLVIILVLIVFIVGFISGLGLLEIFTTSVALAVSAIPEGLLVGLTVVLAIGMQKILKKKGLVRNLVSAETLGGVTTICVDKTGTLTEGKMQVTDTLGDEVYIAKQALIANDMDDPIVTSLWGWASKKVTNKDLNGVGIDEYLKEHERIDSIPFSSKARFFASLNYASSDRKLLFVNGAPEFLVDWCNLPKAKKKKIKKEIDKLTGEGKRLIAMAKKEVGSEKDKITSDDVKGGLKWVGLVAFSDPMRAGVKEALKKVKNANVKLIVITGDYAQTAVSLLKNLNIEIGDNNIVLGSELEKMQIDSLKNKLDTTNFLLFARTTPSQKLKIVKALKKNDEVVAMMGDGVNDAPALKHADIGIVVGEASDVAKESADLILLDSSFATIVSAIEEGRGIFDNLRKIILYLMSDAFEEIVAVIGSLIIGIFTHIPLPVTAAQILWINLVSDGFPHLALTVDPRAENIMNAAPRDPKEPLVSWWMKELILIISLVGGVLALALFIFFLRTTQDEKLARSIAFATLGANSLIYVFSVRTLREPFWKTDMLENKWLNIAVVAGIFLQIFPFLFEKTRELLQLEKLLAVHWLVIFLTAVFMFIIIELLKYALGKRN
ncbi:cation-translocating P-type ATPase, partial [Patescibacteria group bacterium]